MSEWAICSKLFGCKNLKSYFLVCFFMYRFKNKKKFSSLIIPSFLVSDVSESLRLLTKNEPFAQVVHQKWATISQWFRSLTKNERIARFFEQIAHSLIFLQKQVICSENRWANSQPCFFSSFFKRLGSGTWTGSNVIWETFQDRLQLWCKMYLDVQPWLSE